MHSNLLLIIICLLLLFLLFKKRNLETFSSADEMVRKYFGPRYILSQHIKDPKKMGIRPADDVGQVIGNTIGMIKYANNMTFSPPLGQNFFINSNIECDKQKSHPQCKGKEKWIYVRNKPTGTNKCLRGAGIRLPGSSLKGLAPGMIEDALDIDPLTIMKSFANRGSIGSNVCFPRTEKVGYGNRMRYQTKCSPKKTGGICELIANF